MEIAAIRRTNGTTDANSVGAPGIEPGLYEPESYVLPVYYAPKLVDSTTKSAIRKPPLDVELLHPLLILFLPRLLDPVQCLLQVCCR